MDDNNKLDMLRQLLHNAITSDKELNNGDVLEISQKLDKVIVEVCKEQLNIKDR